MIINKPFWLRLDLIIKEVFGPRGLWPTALGVVTAAEQRCFKI